MGKKVDIRNVIYNDLWDVKYIEKKNNEFGLYLYLSLEIKNFLKKFLIMNGLTLYNYKVNVHEFELKIFLSYFKSPKLMLLLYNLLKLQKTRIIKDSSDEFVKNKNHFRKVLKKLLKKNFKTTKKYELKILKRYYNKAFFKKFIFHKKVVSWHNMYSLNKKIFKTHILKIFKSSISKLNNKDKKVSYFKNDIKYFYRNYLFKKLFKYYYKNRKILLKMKVCFNDSVYHQQKSILFDNNENYGKKIFKNFMNYQFYHKLKLNKTLKIVKINNFVEKIVESLNIFLQNKFSIKIFFHQLNKDIYHLLSFNQLQIIKKIIAQLRRFETSKFFSEGMNLVLFTVLKKDSSQFFADFIALRLKSNTKPNFFFRFLNQSLTLLSKNKISKIKSIKILIKGRFTKASRSKKKTIFVGNKMALMTFSKNIKFAKSTAYGRNGTIGVKVWVYE